MWGRTRSGKTTLALALTGERHRFVAFDPMGEYPGTHVTTVEQLRAAVAKGWRTCFQVSYVPPRGEPWPAALNALAAAVFDMQAHYHDGTDRRPVTFLADELAGAYPNQKPPAGLDNYGDLCRRGSHWGVQLIGISQRPADVSTTFRGATSLDFYFAQRDERSVAAACERLGRAWRDRVQRLSVGDYVALTETGVIEGRTKK